MPTFGTHLNYDFSTAKEKYRAFCAQNTPDVPLFAQPWFLDAACDTPNDWQVILYEEGGRVVGAFPFGYHICGRNKRCIDNPFQAARLGLWLDYGNRTATSNREAFENEVVQYVIDRLPPYDSFLISFDSRFQNWQQFYRNGFQQTTRYSYFISQDPASLFDSFTSKKKREIRLLEKDFEVIQSQDIEAYWTFFSASYEARGRRISYSQDKFKKLADAVLSHQAGIMYFCRAHDDQAITSASFIFQDERRAYNMFNTFLPRKEGSTQSLCTYYAILDALQSRRVFDFEGSMIPGVAVYNSKFNAAQEPYFQISNQSYQELLRRSLRESCRAAYHLARGK